MRIQHGYHPAANFPVATATSEVLPELTNLFSQHQVISKNPGKVGLITHQHFNVNVVGSGRALKWRGWNLLALLTRRKQHWIANGINSANLTFNSESI